MTEAIDPAFPRKVKVGDVEHQQGGLSKREFFAAMAMIGRLSNPLMFDRHAAAWSDVVHDSLKWADSLIDALNGKKPQEVKK